MQCIETSLFQSGDMESKHHFHLFLNALYTKYASPPYNTTDPNVSIAIADNGNVMH